MLCEDPFDSIDDLLEFQLLEMMDGCGSGGPMAPLDAPAIAGGIHGLSAAATGGRINSEDDELSMCKNFETMNSDWLSHFFEDSELNFFNPTGFRSESPISVLETHIASPSCMTRTRTRTRTKRPRARATRPISPSQAHGPSEPKIMEKKKRSTAVDCEAPRKCTHCESLKTPQWRAGPMGPKTLCNACGVRYKSGRLFPEHRPAASPSFIPSVHSSSHKKVVEMRRERANLGSKDCDLIGFIRIK